VRTSARSRELSVCQPCAQHTRTGRGGGVKRARAHTHARVYTLRNKQRNTPQQTRHTRIYTKGYDREKDDGSAGEQRERATQQRRGSEKVRARESGRVCERASKRERKQERKRERVRERESEREREGEGE
jgi:hypothetical protein